MKNSIFVLSFILCFAIVMSSCQNQDSSILTPEETNLLEKKGGNKGNTELINYNVYIIPDNPTDPSYVSPILDPLVNPGQATSEFFSVTWDNNSDDPGTYTDDVTVTPKLEDGSFSNLNRQIFHI